MLIHLVLPLSRRGGGGVSTYDGKKHLSVVSLHCWARSPKLSMYFASKVRDPPLRDIVLDYCEVEDKGSITTIEQFDPFVASLRTSLLW